MTLISMYLFSQDTSTPPVNISLKLILVLVGTGLIIACDQGNKKQYWNVVKSPFKIKRH